MYHNQGVFHHKSYKFRSMRHIIIIIIMIIIITIILNSLDLFFSPLVPFMWRQYNVHFEILKIFQNQERGERK